MRQFLQCRAFTILATTASSRWLFLIKHRCHTKAVLFMGFHLLPVCVWTFGHQPLTAPHKSDHRVSVVCICSVRFVMGYASILFWVAVLSAAVGLYDTTLVRVRLRHSQHHWCSVCQLSMCVRHGIAQIVQSMQLAGM